MSTTLHLRIVEAPDLALPFVVVTGYDTPVSSHLTWEAAALAISTANQAGWVASTGSASQAVAVDATRPATTPLQFKLLCTLLMCADPSPLSPDDDAVVVLWLTAEAQRHGFGSWVEAFHGLGHEPQARP